MFLRLARLATLVKFFNRYAVHRAPVKSACTLGERALLETRVWRNISTGPIWKCAGPKGVVSLWGAIHRALLESPSTQCRNTLLRRDFSRIGVKSLVPKYKSPAPLMRCLELAARLKSSPCRCRAGKFVGVACLLRLDFEMLSSQILEVRINIIRMLGTPNVFRLIRNRN